MSELSQGQAAVAMPVQSRAKAIIFLCYLAGLSALAVLGMTIGLPALPAMEKSLNVATGYGVYTLSIFQAGFAAGPLICGPLSDRFGRRKIIMLGLWGMVFTSIGSALAPSMAVMLIFRAIQGLSSGFCVVMPMAVIRDMFTGDEARSYQGQVNAIVAIAPLAAPFLGNVIYQTMGWRMVFVFLAAASVVLLLYTIFSMKESLPQESRQSIAPRVIIQNYWKLLRHPVYMSASFTYIFAFSALFAFVSGSSIVFMQHLEVSSTTYSLIFIFTSACGMVGAFTSAALSRRGVISFFQFNVGFMFILASASLIFFAPWLGVATPALIVVFASLNDFGFCLNTPNSIHEALVPVSGIVGAASGLMRSLQMGFASLASLLVAALIGGKAERSVTAVGGVMLLCAILSFASYLLLRFKRR